MKEETREEEEKIRDGRRDQMKKKRRSEMKEETR